MQLFDRSDKPGINGGAYFFSSRGFFLASHLYIVPWGNEVEALCNWANSVMLAAEFVANTFLLLGYDYTNQTYQMQQAGQTNFSFSPSA